MSIEKTGTILKDSQTNGYAVAAFNVFNYETISFAIEVASEERVPVIIQFYPKFVNFIKMSTVASITKDIASRAKVPIGLHLDHSDSFEEALHGIKSGFESVMIDGSLLSFEENVKLTKKVAEAAHAFNADVESELGYVGMGDNLDDFTNTDNFTKAEDAAEFVTQTKTDFLAIAFGNGHGQYIKSPMLDIERLKNIKKNVNIPLVLHGGSDIPDEQVKNAVLGGINKVNIATEYFRAIYNSIQSHTRGDAPKTYMYGCITDAKQPVKEFIRSKIGLLNPRGYHI